MTRIAQFRFYSDGHENNYPFKNYQNYCSSESFGYYRPIHQLGIQTLPGTKIYLNQSLNPIVIGGTGVYEIDCTGTGATITSFRVEQASMETINNLPNGYLIIDIVYGDKED